MRPLKTEKRSGPQQAGGSARLHCLCDMRRHSGTVARARQVRGVRHCKSLAALNVPRVYVGAVRQRFGRTHGPALVCPDRSTGPDFLPRATLLTFSPRTSEKSCPLCPRATRANCLICSPRTSETFCPRFSWAGFQIGQYRFSDSAGCILS